MTTRSQKPTNKTSHMELILKISKDLPKIKEQAETLANEPRLKILQLLRNNDGLTLSEVFEHRKNIGLAHRETTYDYLEKLVQAGFLEKRDDGKQGIKYFCVVDSITIMF